VAHALARPPAPERVLKHLLLVSYYFPPAGGVLVRRVLRMLRHLPRHGWGCTVLTADAPYDPYHPEDSEGVAHVPASEAVLRPPARAGVERALARGFEAWRRLRRPEAGGTTATEEVAASGPEGGRARRLLHETLLFPDAKRLWVRGAVAAALAEARRRPFDAVLATGYPWSAFCVADRVRAALDVPMVLDFRDAWTLNPRAHWSGARNRALERALLSRADAATFATDWIRDEMRARHSGSAHGRFETITNGFDPEEQPEADPSLAESGRMVLTCTGSFNDALPPSRFDNSPFHLLRAVAALPPDVRASLRVRLVGRLGPVYRSWIREQRLDDVVDVVGPVPHRRALQHQLAADVLFLAIGDAPAAAAVLTGKLVEYVGARRPVLALAPDCEASRAVRRHGLGWVEPPDDAVRIGARLRDLLARWRVDGLAAPDLRELPFSAPAEVSRLARLLDALPS